MTRLSQLGLSPCKLSPPILDGTVSIPFTHSQAKLGHHSCIDHFLFKDSSDNTAISNLSVSIIDHFENFSDHLPIHLQIPFSTDLINSLLKGTDIDKPTVPESISSLNWDKADIDGYYDYTRLLLEPIFNMFTVCKNQHSLDSFNIDDLEHFYFQTVHALKIAGKTFVPSHKKNFTKFWWDEQMRSVTDTSMIKHRIWIEAGKPRSGWLPGQPHRTQGCNNSESRIFRNWDCFHGSMQSGISMPINYWANHGRNKFWDRKYNCTHVSFGIRYS